MRLPPSLTGGKAVRNAPPGFAEFRPSDTSRSAAEILSHIGDLMDWALSILKDATNWKSSHPRAWEEEVRRFHSSIGARRLAGSPVKGENYFIADIETGRVGPDQPVPRREFG